MPCVVHRTHVALSPPSLRVQFRHQAQSLGIPFISITAASVPELRRSLLPVFDLYTGKLTLQQALPGKGRATGRVAGRATGRRVVRK